MSAVGGDSPRSPYSWVPTTLAVIVVWQIQVAFTAHRLARAFAGLFGGLGAQPPLPTQAFFASYRWWPVVPAGFVLLLLDLRRRSPRPVWYLVLLVGIALAAALVMAMWSTEACLGPMLSLIKQIG